MGVVYKARQVRLNRLVALKMILAGGHAGEEERARFRREAEAVARLQHPNIVQIHDVGESEGRPFFSLELVEGGSLDRKANGTPLQPGEAARLVKDLALAVEAAHAQGIIHRDLKPANVLLTSDGQPKITDFGLAKQVGGAGQTQSGAILGTPSYMAPEQADGQGKQIGPAADVYALGAVLYELLTGRPPFRAATPLDTVLQVISEEPVAPTQLQPKVPRDLETICLKCLRKEPAKRYPTARELADELGRFLAGDSILARPVGVPERTVRWMRKNPGKAATAAAALLVAGFGIAFLVVNNRRERDRAESLERANDATTAALKDARRRKTEAERAGASARKARDQADTARRKAVAAEQVAQKARDLAVEQLYATRISLANQEWHQNNVYRTEQLLDECPASLRGWEWDFLKGLCRQERRTLYGHMNPVQFLAVSPDGRHLASVDSSSTHFWDLTTGREISTYGANGPLAFSPDSNRLAVTYEKVVKVLDPLEGSEVCALPEAKDKVLAVAFAEQGRCLVTVTFNDHTVHRWDATTGREQRSIPLPDKLFDLNSYGGQFAPVLSGDGTLLAAGSDWGEARVWNTATGRRVFSANDGPLMHVTRTAFNPNGDRLAVAWAEGTVMVRELPSGKVLRRWRAHRSSVDSLAFSPDGKLLATGSQDLSVRLWDLGSFEEVHVLRGHAATIGTMAFTPDGKELVTGSGDRSIKVWHLDDRRYFSWLRRQANLARRLFSGAPVRLPPSNFEHRTFYGHVSPNRCLAFSPDGRLVATGGNGDGYVFVWDLATNKVKAALSVTTGQRRASVLKFTPDSKGLMGLIPPSGSAPAEARLWDIERRSLVRKRKGPSGNPAGLVCSPDGKSVVVAFATGQSSRLCWWEVPSLKETTTLDLEGTQIHSLALSPQGNRLVAGGAEQVVVVDAAIRKVKRSFRVPAMTCLALNRNGILATGHPDMRIRLFDLRTGKLLRELEGHVGAVVSLDLSPDGRRLVSVGSDRAIKIWNVATGRELLTFRDHTREIERVAWGPDGRKIGSVGWDHALRIWEAALAAGPSSDKWPVLFADRFNRPTLGPPWQAGTNWSIERGASRGRLIDTLLPGGGDKFQVASLTLPRVRLPDMVQVRFECWASAPLVCSPVLANLHTGFTIQPLLIGKDQPFGYTGAALLLMRDAGSQGTVVGVPRRQFRFLPGRHYRVRILRERTWQTLTVDGQVLFREAIPAGPAPTLLLTGSWGQPGDAIHFANLEVRAPHDAVREQKIRDRVEAAFDRSLLRAAVEEEIRKDGSLNEADRQFALGQLSALREDPTKLVTACQAVVLQPGRTREAYALALRQAETAARLNPSYWPGLFPLGCAQYRAGNYAAAEQTLTRALEAHRKDQGCGAPNILAALAMAQHRLGRTAASRLSLTDAGDLMRGTGWARIESARALVREAEALVGPIRPEQREADAVQDAVFGADQAGWYYGDLAKYLAAFTDDCLVVDARAEQPAAWDVVYDRRLLGEVRKQQMAATAAWPSRVSYESVRVRVRGHQAECRYRSTVPGASSFQTWEIVTRLRKTAQGWKIFASRSWPVLQKAEVTRVFDGPYWAARDRAVERARREGSVRELTRALEAAFRYAEALPVVRGLTGRGAATAEDWARRGRIAFTLGRTGEAASAFREALRKDPGLVLPWYASRHRRTLGNGTAAVLAVAWQPHGTQIASGGLDGLVKLWDGTTGKLHRSLHGHLGWIRAIAYQPGSRLIATGGTDHFIKLWAAGTGRLVRTLHGHRGRVHALTFDPAGQRLVSSSADKTARVWDVARGRELLTLEHPAEVTAAVFSPDGQQIATACRDGTARLWEAATGGRVRILPGHRAEVGALAYAPNGQRLATASGDGTVRLWDPSNGKGLTILRGHTAAVQAVAFSLDGRWLASGGNGTEIILWDGRSGARRETVRGHGGVVFDLAFSPDSRKLASASTDGTVRIWDMSER
jgi:WD40 repeat protein